MDETNLKKVPCRYFKYTESPGYNRLREKYGKKHAVVDFVQMSCGALLRDDFSGERLDTTKWRIWQCDEGVSISVEDSALVVSGITTSRDKSHRYCGVVSKGAVTPFYLKCFGMLDVVLEAEMMAPTGFTDKEGYEEYQVHLCGTRPDCWIEACYCRITPCWVTPIMYYPERKPGWYASYVSYEGHDVPLPGVPPLGNEETDYIATKIVNDNHTKTATSYIKSLRGWEEIGKIPISLSSTKIELKLNTNIADIKREVRFKNCRLYPHPKYYPVRFVVWRIHPKIKALNGGEVLEGIKIEIKPLIDNSQSVEGLTDRHGVCELFLPDVSSFPVGAEVKLSFKEREIGSFFVERKGVEGIYPGDVRTIQVYLGESR